MGLWLQNLMEANLGKVLVEELDKGEGPYCFEKAVVMRHNVGKMGKEKKLQVSDLLRCKARVFCGINPTGRGKEVGVRGEPIIRVTLLMRGGSRSFKDPIAVISIFARECAVVDGCMLEVVQSEDLSFCDQVCPLLHYFSRGKVLVLGIGMCMLHLFTLHHFVNKCVIYDVKGDCVF